MSPFDSDRAEALRLLKNVSRETLQRLDAYVGLLRQWQPKVNLVAPSTVDRMWTRHIADSLQLLPLAPEARIWIDLGSGAGFPGLPLACALAEREQAQVQAHVHLVESDQRKAAFLREAIRVTGVAAQVHAERIERLAEKWTGPVDVVTARALAPLPKLMGYLVPFLEKGAKALVLKGQDVEAELTQAAKSWHIEAELLPSATNSRARIVSITCAKPVQKSG